VGRFCSNEKEPGIAVSHSICVVRRAVGIGMSQVTVQQGKFAVREYIAVVEKIPPILRAFRPNDERESLVALSHRQGPAARNEHEKWSTRWIKIPAPRSLDGAPAQNACDGIPWERTGAGAVSESVTVLAGCRKVNARRGKIHSGAEARVNGKDFAARMNSCPPDSALPKRA
jgi:hypothetical protein